MEFILRKVQKAGVFGWLYAASLFHAFHFFSIHYINSSFLERYVSQSDVGLVIAVSSALTVLTVLTTTVFLAVFGNYRTAIAATFVNFLVSLGLGFSGDVGWLFVFFAVHTIMIPVTLFTLDVFLESNTQDENTTGSVRGIFLSMGMIAALVAPTLSGMLAGDENKYEYAYIASALFLIPVLIILIARFRTFEDPRYEILSPGKMVSALFHNRNLFHVSMAQFLMRFFFSWYVVYLPIYLNQTVGFSWPEIGIILFVMLVPYILLEYPAGRLADKYFGEKEIMAVGFVISAASTASLFFFSEPVLWLWAAILFFTRAGTALIESMTETYFFKQIDGDDTSILSIFRMLRPLGYMVGPFLAGMLILFVSIQTLWIILAVIMLLGVFHAYALEDTK